MKLCKRIKISQERSYDSPGRTRHRPSLPRPVPIQRNWQGTDPSAENCSTKVDEQLSSERIWGFECVLWGKEDLAESAVPVRLRSVDEDNGKGRQNDEQ